MMYSQVCWLLLLVITAAVRVYCELDDIPLIQWDADCDSYEVTTRVKQRVASMHYQESATPAQCRSLCTGRTDCGGFVSGRGLLGKHCFLYNINDQIIEQYLSQNWYDSNWMTTWYSKTCDYNLGESDMSCDIYTNRQYHSQYPVDKWMITDTFWSIPDLNATECQQWCTLYTGCRSATYKRDERGSGYCHLYETTIQDLLDRGLDGDVKQETITDDTPTITTYDRYCASGDPYIPASGCQLSPLQSIHIY